MSGHILKRKTDRLDVVARQKIGKVAVPAAPIQRTRDFRQIGAGLFKRNAVLRIGGVGTPLKGVFVEAARFNFGEEFDGVGHDRHGQALPRRVATITLYSPQSTSLER